MVREQLFPGSQSYVSIMYLRAKVELLRLYEIDTHTHPKVANTLNYLT